MKELPPGVQQYLQQRQAGQRDPEAEAVLEALVAQGQLDRSVLEPQAQATGGQGPDALSEVGRGAAALGIGMAGPALGAAVGSMGGPLAPVTVPMGAILGSYGARQLNKAIGLEKPSMLGDLLAVGLPAGGYGASSALKSMAKSSGGLGAAFGRGAITGGVTQAVTGDSTTAGIAGGIALYAPILIKQVAKTPGGKAVIAALAKTRELMGPMGIAAMLGFLRSTGELATEPEEK